MKPGESGTCMHNIILRSGVNICEFIYIYNAIEGARE